MLQPADPRDQEIIAWASRRGQGHIFRYWDELSGESREKLLSQVRAIDFDLLHQLTEQFILNREERRFKGELEPAPIIPLPRTRQEKQKAEEAKAVGEKMLQAGKVAAVVVAGGQGTRLGYPHPKGKFPIGPVTGKSLFQLHAEKLRALSKRYGVAIPWYIMTSEDNDAETKAFFEEYDYFSLGRENVFFFCQGMMPALDEQGKLFLDAPDHVFTSPEGHGGCLKALKKSGALEDTRRRGIEEIFYFQVDNPLVKVCDPTFIGYHTQAGAEMSLKVVRKRDPYEKVGVVGRRHGKFCVIEYSDLSKEDAEAHTPDGQLKYWAGSIAIHMLKVSFVERLNQGDLSLPFHVAHKKIPYLDDAGTRVEPEAPNGYKFETFIFDALSQAKQAIVMEVLREEEFSPVKNATGQNSPATARQAMINLYGGWLEKAGVVVPRDDAGHVQGRIEISPLYALDEQELVEKVRGAFTLGRALYLE